MHEFARGRYAGATSERIAVRPFEFGQDSGIEAGRRQGREPSVAVERRHALQPDSIEFAGAADLQTDQTGEIAGWRSGQDRFRIAPERFDFIDRQVEAPGLSVLGHIANDVRELHRHSERVSVSKRRVITASEHRRGQQPDRSGDGMAIAGQFGPGLVPARSQIAANAVDQLQRRF